MGYKALAWNAHSVNQHKKIELINFLEKNPHDFLMLSETWLRSDWCFGIDGYSCYRVDRKHGGVALLIKSKIPHSSLVSNSLPYAEAISVKIHDPLGNFYISSIYCSPSCNRDQHKLFFKRVMSIPGQSIISGDFNAKHAAWNCSGAGRDSAWRKGRDLFDLCQEKVFPYMALTVQLQLHRTEIPQRLTLS